MTDKFLSVPNKRAHEAGAAAEGLALELVTGNWHRLGEDFGQSMLQFCNEVKHTVITQSSLLLHPGYEVIPWQSGSR